MTDLAWWKTRAIQRYAELRRARTALDSCDRAIAAVFAALEGRDVVAADDIRAAIHKAHQRGGSPDSSEAS